VLNHNMAWAGAGGLWRVGGVIRHVFQPKRSTSVPLNNSFARRYIAA